MIQRRQFLGAASAAAVCLTAPVAFGASAALSWSSRVIQTVRHGKLKRKPVVTGVSLQAEGNLLAIVGDDHYVSLYDIKSQQFVEHLKKHTDWVRSARFTPDSSALFTGGNDHRLIRWETDRLTEPTFSIGHDEAIIELAISHDSKKVATVGFSNQLVIHRADNGSASAVLKCACDDNHAVAWSPDDKLIAAGGRCGTIRIWDTATQQKTHEISAHRRRIRSLEFTVDGDLVSAGDDQLVKIHKLSDATQTVSLPRHASKLFALKALAPAVIATSGSDNRIHIWNTRRGSEIGTLDSHTGTVSCLDMAQGMLVSGSFDTTVRIWTPNPEELALAAPRFVTPQLSQKQASAKPRRTPGVWTTRR